MLRPYSPEAAQPICFCMTILGLIVAILANVGPAGTVSISPHVPVQQDQTYPDIVNLQSSEGIGDSCLMDYKVRTIYANLSGLCGDLDTLSTGDLVVSGSSAQYSGAQGN